MSVSPGWWGGLNLVTWAKLWFGVRKEENLEGGAWYASELQLPPSPPLCPRLPLGMPEQTVNLVLPKVQPFPRPSAGNH